MVPAEITVDTAALRRTGGVAPTCSSRQVLLTMDHSALVRPAETADRKYSMLFCPFVMCHDLIELMFTCFRFADTVVEREEEGVEGIGEGERAFAIKEGVADPASFDPQIRCSLAPPE